MSAVPLNPKQQVLRDEIQKDLDRIYETFKKRPSEQDLLTDLICNIGKKAHKLHCSLKRSGHPPIHHDYMIKNREMKPDHIKFYMHVHPVEDLLKFIENEDANRDPEDKTIGHEFKFKVYSHRWGYEDTYIIKRTAYGWHVSFRPTNGPCDKRGYPTLFDNFRYHSIAYPHDLGSWLEELWYKAQDKGLSHDQVKKALDSLSEWVEKVEKTAPRNPVFGYAA